MAQPWGVGKDRNGNYYWIQLHGNSIGVQAVPWNFSTRVAAVRHAKNELRLLGAQFGNFAQIYWHNAHKNEDVMAIGFIRLTRKRLRG